MFKQIADPSSSQAGGICLLLTACVSPGQVIALARRDFVTRLDDYERAMKGWIRVKGIDGIVFCENSMADLSSLQDMVRAASDPRPEVEFLSFQGQDFDPSLGKGYGEMQIIRYALEHSKMLTRAKMIIKVTGRLFISNIETFARSAAESEGIELFCDLRNDLTSADSRFFYGTRNFFVQYLLSYQDTVNDSAGVCFENVLARAAHQAMADGRRCALLPRAHRMEGVDATSDRVIPSGVLTQVRRELFRWVKSRVLMR